MNIYYNEEEYDYLVADDFISLNKQGQPRKRKPKEPRIYFTDETENAILEYLSLTNQSQRDKLYKDKIQYAFYKLAENIIHTFKFYYTDSDTIEELKHEVVTFLLEKLHLYNQGKGKAFSYFGTIAKRYLIIYNEKNYKKLQEMVELEETNDDSNLDIHDNMSSYDSESDYDNFINLYIKYIDKNLYSLFPKKADYKAADAIMELFRKRESLDIFNKKALYIYIREITDASTPQITKITKKLNDIRIKLYNKYYEDGYIKI